MVRNIVAMLQTVPTSGTALARDVWSRTRLRYTRVTQADSLGQERPPADYFFALHERELFGQWSKSGEEIPRDTRYSSTDVGAAPAIHGIPLMAWARRWVLAWFALPVVCAIGVLFPPDVAEPRCSEPVYACLLLAVALQGRLRLAWKSRP